MSKIKEAIMDGLIVQEPPDEESPYAYHTPPLRSVSTDQSLSTESYIQRFIHAYFSVDGCRFDSVHPIQSQKH